MSSDSLVLDWLNNEIKFNPKVINIKEEFSNGYKFGEILYKLKEITIDKLKSLKKKAHTFEDKKSNFSIIKKLFQRLYSLEVREEEFNLILEKDSYKAIIILYKLKNSFYKKKINFSNIKLFINQPKPEEIQKKVKEIMDNEYFQEKSNIESSSHENNIFNQSDSYSNLNRFISSRDNSQYSTSRRKNSIISIKIQDNNKENEEIDDNDSEILNKDLNYNDKKIKIIENNINYENKNINIFNSETKRKKFLPPLSPIISNTNIQKVFKNNKKSLFSSYDNYTSREKDIIKNKEISNMRNKLMISEKKIKKNKDYLSTENLYDENKDEMLKKLRENLKKKLENKKVEDKKKQEYFRKELNLYEVPEIDFFKPEKNPLFKKKLPEMILSYSNNNRYLINSSTRRLKYCNNLTESKKLKILENRKEYYKNIFIKNSENISKNLKKLRMNIKSDINAEEQSSHFNKEKFIKNLNKLDYIEYNNLITKKHLQMKNDFPLIKEIIYLIIDYTVEGYFYQKENNIELINIPLFINLSSLFMNNKPAKEKVPDDEADIIKEVKKEDEFNIDDLVLTIDDTYLTEDYLNYCGMFDQEKILDGEKNNELFDIHIVNNNLPDDYELTQIDIDDMTIPKYYIDNCIYGDSILEILDNKYENKNNKELKEIDYLKSKWNYIPYKISLIGYPLSGRKTLAEKIIKKYPNIKIYSCQKLLREYYNTYLLLTEEINIDNQKYKSMKPNQIEQLKQERQKELENFGPILKIINPYIEQISKDKENNINDNSKYTPPNDLVLFEILKNKIETDFQIKSNEENINEIIEYQTKINKINQQIEDIKKIISENNKPNPKDEQTLSNLEKEKQNLKQNYINGFILVDFPTNINQCNILEKYLTGYISDLEKPKTEKILLIESLEDLIDFKFRPPQNKKIKRSGLDFLINLAIPENIIIKRYNEIKYDPIDDKIYTKTEINESKDIDKKIIDRFINEVPYLSKEIFDYYIEEYNDNFSKINLFYNNFGITIKKDNDLNNILDLIDEKEIKKTYQNLELMENEKIEMNKIIDYISDNIIDVIYNEKNKSDKIIFYSKYPELNNNEEIDRIEFVPELENSISKNKKEKEDNSLQETKKRKGTKKFTRKAGNSNINEIKYINDIKENSNKIFQNLNKFSKYYKKNIGCFNHLISLQRQDIYSRLNLIQKKFRDFLNYKTEKNKIISLFVKKYNSFFNANPQLFFNQKAIDEFVSDIDELNNTLWRLINIKQKECVKELDIIKNSGFIENELVKFYNNIKNIFLVETEKFILMIDSIFNLFNVKKDKVQNNEEVYTKEIILENIFPIKNVLNLNKNKNTIDENNLNSNIPKALNDLISNILKNIELFFINGMKLLYKQQNKTENLIKLTKEVLMQSIKKGGRRKNKNSNESFSSSQMMISMNGTKGNDLFEQEEKIRKIFQNEKNKYKYKLNFLKIFCKKYLNIIHLTTENIYNNVDGWVIKSVSLQNNALNLVIQKIKGLLNNKKLINEKEDIQPIEMDAFETEEKNYNDENKNDIIIKPIDDKSIETNSVYFKLNIDYLLNDNFINMKIENTKSIDNSNNVEETDFYFDINKYFYCFKYIKNFEIEENVIGQNIFYEIFFKQFLLNKYNEINIKNNEEKKDETEENLGKNKEDEQEDEDKLKNKEKKGKNKIYLLGFSKALRKINSKQIFKLFNLYKIQIENHEMEKNINKDIVDLNKEKNDKLEIEDNEQNEEAKEKTENEDANQINKEEKKEEKIMLEYETYLKYKEIFTILALIGCEILTVQEEEKIIMELNNKIINKNFLNKKDFFEYNFWFQKYFDYQDYLNNENNEWILDDYKDKKMNIKDLLFEIWKDDNGNNINIRQLLSILKIGKYITDLNNNNNKKYFDLLFK